MPLLYQIGSSPHFLHLLFKSTLECLPSQPDEGEGQGSLPRISYDAVSSTREKVGNGTKVGLCPGDLQKQMKDDLPRDLPPSPLLTRLNQLL